MHGSDGDAQLGAPLGWNQEGWGHTAPAGTCSVPPCVTTHTTTVCPSLGIADCTPWAPGLAQSWDCPHIPSSCTAPEGMGCPISLRVALGNSLRSPRAPQCCGSTVPQHRAVWGRGPGQQHCRAVPAPLSASYEQQHCHRLLCCRHCAAAGGAGSSPPWVQPSLPPHPVPMDAGNCRPSRAHGKINELITSTAHPEPHRLAALPKALCAAQTPDPGYDPQPCSMERGLPQLPPPPQPSPAQPHSWLQNLIPTTQFHCPQGAEHPQNRRVITAAALPRDRGRMGANRDGRVANKALLAGLTSWSKVLQDTPS